MAPALSLHFPDVDPEAGPFAGSLVHRAHIAASLGAPFEVSLTVHSTDPAVDPHAVVGLRAELRMEGEPHVDRIPGIVRAMRQLTSVPTAHGLGASYYEVILVPALSLARHRTGRRLHQNKDTVSIVRDTLRAAHAQIPEPIANLSRMHASREHTTQYEESDLDFVYRVLAEEHLVSYFDPTKDSALVIVDEVASLTPRLPFRLAYTPPSNLEPSVPVAIALRLEDGYAPGGVGLRDYELEHPQMSRGVPVTLAGDAQVTSSDRPFPTEVSLVSEGYAVGRFASEPDGQAIAKRDLVGLRAGARIIECETNIAILPGTRFFVDHHPRSDTLGELLVVSARIHLDDGAPLPISAGASSPVGLGRPRRIYSFRCVRVEHGYLPRPRLKPRAIGPETAFVVGALEEGQIDVDEYGRVLIEFVWDRRDQRTGAPSRRVRVSQGWAGSNRGFVTLPRIGDEVLIGFDGGDPDQPIIVGRVHNAVARTPLDVPEPDKTVSVWKSRTVGGDGFNQILMDDKSAAERLEIRAEKTRTDLTLGSESSTVGGNYNQEVGGEANIHVRGATAIELDDTLDVRVGGDVSLAFEANLKAQVAGTASLNADGGWVISGPTITLQASGASIVLGNGNVTIKADGKICIEAGGLVDVDAPLITLN